MNCSNCNARLSCGCQRRRASDGKQCCSTCVAGYEQKIKGAPSSFTTPPITPSINRNIWGASRYVPNK
jgi:hypothetical protein